MEIKQLHTHIDKENINEMVIAFYTKILKEDGPVAKVFIDKLGNDINGTIWQKHFEILTNFWTNLTLGEPLYNGRPLQAHFDLPLDKNMFSTWLMLFFETVDNQYEPHLAQGFKIRAENIAMNFMRRLNVS